MTVKQWVDRCRSLVREHYGRKDDQMARIEIFQAIKNRESVLALSGFFIDRGWDWQSLYPIQEWLQRHPFPSDYTVQPKYISPDKQPIGVFWLNDRRYNR